RQSTVAKQKQAQLPVRHTRKPGRDRREFENGPVVQHHPRGHRRWRGAAREEELSGHVRNPRAITATALDVETSFHVSSKSGAICLLRWAGAYRRWETASRIGNVIFCAR